MKYERDMRRHREDMHREENISVRDCFKLQCKGCPAHFTLEQETQLVRHIKTCAGWQSKDQDRAVVSRMKGSINKHLADGARQREEEVRRPSSLRREERSRSRESRNERSEHYPKRVEKSSFREQGEERERDGPKRETGRFEDGRRVERSRHEDARGDERSRQSLHRRQNFCKNA